MITISFALLSFHLLRGYCSGNISPRCTHNCHSIQSRTLKDLISRIGVLLQYPRLHTRGFFFARVVWTGKAGKYNLQCPFGPEPRPISVQRYFIFHAT